MNKLKSDDVFSPGAGNRIHKLDNKFFNRPNVVLIARELLGKILVTCFEKKITSGRIVETEAYIGKIDRACHAHLENKSQ